MNPATPRAPSAVTAEGATLSPLSIDDVRVLAQLCRDFDLVELELCRPSGEQLRIRRGAGAHATVSAAVPALVAAPALAPAQGAGEELRYITSPFVGTFYRAAGPGAAVFVEEGQRVRKGQTLCIIEAMKLMNELEAEFDCVVIQCLAQNGRPVEYGERLFAVRPA